MRHIVCALCTLWALGLISCKAQDPLYCDYATPCAPGHTCVMPDRECVDCTAAPGVSYKYATNSIKLPSNTASFAIDIDGDGKADNQLRAIINAVSAAMFDLDGPIVQAVADGDAVILADMQAANLMAGCARLTLGLAKAPGMGGAKPKFDGNDKFTLNMGAQAPLMLSATITDSKLSSPLPKEQKGTQVQKIVLPLPLSVGTLPLPIYGAHVSGTIQRGQDHGG